MKGNILFFAIERFQNFKVEILLCLLCSLFMNACGSGTPMPTPPTALPVPTINAPNGRCELSPGETLPLAVTGMCGKSVVYSWSATRGNVMPSEGANVLYTAPDMGGDDIVRVEALVDGQSSAGVITCVVSSPTPTATRTPSVTPTPTVTTTITPIPIKPAGYEICGLGNGSIRVTLNPPDGEGNYNYSPSKEFKAQRDDSVMVVIKRLGDGQVWAKTIRISMYKDYPNCSASPAEENPDPEPADDNEIPPVRPPTGPVPPA